MLRFFVINLLILTFISCGKRDNSSSKQDSVLSKSDSNDIVSFKSTNSFRIDSTILRTDSLGNILGGDRSDWDYDNRNYEEIMEKEFSDLYNNPGKIFMPQGQSFFFQLKNGSVVLTWFTSREINCKGYDVERTKSLESNSDWEKVGFVKGHGNSDKLITYNYADKNLIDGIYMYRLKQISSTGEFEYFNLAGLVNFTNYKEYFEFYPVFPNPVSNKFTVRMFLSESDTVSLYFLNGKDTLYILNHEPQQRGFNKLEVDKKSLGYENEVKRLYINCNTCSKRKNFGDVQF